MCWWVKRGTDMFAAHCLFNRKLHINSAGENKNVNVSFQDGGQIKNLREMVG
jgi:hypothetical protein